MSLRARFGSLDPIIVALTVGLVVIGLAMLMSASGPLAVQRTGDGLFYVKRQLLTGVLPGSILFLFFALIDYRRWKSFAFIALFVTLGILALVFVPGIGVEHGGARGWIEFGVLSLQPSELVKLTFLIYLAAWLSRRREEAHVVQTGLLPFLCALGAVMLLIVLEPDTGSMAVVVGMSLVLYFISGAPLIWFVSLCVAGASGLALLIKYSTYRAARFMTFLHPELDPRGVGYHINQAMLAIGSGGWWGLGFGLSRQKYLYLPEVEADSIFAVMAEELGLLLTLVVLAVFAALIWRCFKIALESRDPFGTYLAAGVGAWVGIQTLLNIGSMTGLLPMTGVTLPFVSHGGSSLAVLLGAMGLVSAIPRSNRRGL